MNNVESGKQRVAVSNSSYTQYFDVNDLTELQAILKESLVKEVSLAHSNPWDDKSFDKSKSVDELTEKDFLLLTTRDSSTVYYWLEISKFDPLPQLQNVTGVCAWCGGTQKARQVGKVVRWHPQIANLCRHCFGR